MTTIRAAEQWQKMMIKASETKIGNDFISECIRFMTKDVVSHASKGVLKYPNDARAYTNYMRVLINLLLMEKLESITSSEYLRIRDLDNGCAVVVDILKRIAENPSARTRTKSISELIKKYVARLEVILNDDVLKNIFDAIASPRTCSKNTPLFNVMKFKTKLYRELGNVRTGHRRKGNDYNTRAHYFDRYFLSLAIVGKAAASIYGEYQDESLSKNACVFQSLASPEFDFGRFLSDGPVALFYGNNGMMFEIGFVISDGVDRDCYDSVRDMWRKYRRYVSLDGSDSDQWQGKSSPNSLLAYLCVCHGIDRRISIQAKHERLKAKLGTNLGDPAYAFTRDF
jgi:hypothetical protein